VPRDKKQIPKYQSRRQIGRKKEKKRVLVIKWEEGTNYIKRGGGGKEKRCLANGEGF